MLLWIKSFAPLHDNTRTKPLMVSVGLSCSPCENAQPLTVFLGIYIMTKFIEIPANKSSIAKRRNVLGVGINDAWYLTQPKIDGKIIMCKYYQTWMNMLKRCYCKKLHKRRPTYIDCMVCNDWLKFSNFKSWMETKDWENKHLDKDLKVLGNKLYSPNTCCFTSNKVNNILAHAFNKKGNITKGVIKYGKKFKSSCMDEYGNHLRSIETFSTESEAHEMWRTIKKKVILKVANLPENLEIKEYIIKQSLLI